VNDGCGDTRHDEGLLVTERAVAVTSGQCDTLKDVRDRALLSFGMVSCLRRSEITALDVSDVATSVWPGCSGRTPATNIAVQIPPPITGDAPRCLARPARPCCTDRMCGRSYPSPGCFQAMRTEIGCPSSSMRLSAWATTSTSVGRRAGAGHAPAAPAIASSICSSATWSIRSWSQDRSRQSPPERIRPHWQSRSFCHPG